MDAVLLVQTNKIAHISKKFTCIYYKSNETKENYKFHINGYYSYVLMVIQYGIIQLTKLFLLLALTLIAQL